MKLVGVKHQPNQEIVYWFEVPESIANIVCIGDEVLCNTRKGQNKATVVQLMEDVPNAINVVGDFFPLKKVIAVAKNFEITNIHIPWEMNSSAPNPEKIAQRMNEFYATGGFKTAVLFTPDGNLKDGYTAYLVAKMFGHDTLRGFCVAED